MTSLPPTPASRQPRQRPLTQAMQPGDSRVLPLQLLRGSPFRRVMTIGSLIAFPLVAYAAQFWATLSFGSPDSDPRPLMLVETIAIILLVGVYAIWRLVHRHVRPIEDLLARQRNRRRMGRLVRRSYGHKYSQLLGASACAISCMILVVASSWPHVEVGLVIAMGELSFFAPNSMYWALKLAQFTRILAASRLRLGQPDPRENFAIQRLGAVVAGAIALIGLEAMLTVLTILLLAQSLGTSGSFGWRSVVLLGVLSTVLGSMALVALNFLGALTILRVRVWTELRIQVELRQNELDLLPTLTMTKNARRSRRRRIEAELKLLRSPRPGWQDRWWQLGLALLALPITLIANLVSATWSVLAP